MQTDIRNSWLLLGVRIACMALVLTIAFSLGYFWTTWFGIGILLTIYEYGPRWKAILREFRRVGGRHEYRSVVVFDIMNFFFFLFFGPLAICARRSPF